MFSITIQRFGNGSLHQTLINQISLKINQLESKSNIQEIEKIAVLIEEKPWFMRRKKAKPKGRYGLSIYTLIKMPG